MIEPKIFYRKMDRLLGEIADLHANEDFLEFILTELERSFGEELHIHSGHLYEEVAGNFELKTHTSPEPKFALSFKSSAPEVADIVQYSGRIFEKIEPGCFLGDCAPLDNCTPVAIMVKQGTHRRWMIVFCLSEGWNYEEIAFCLNAVRSALNNRLRVDAALSDLEKAAAIQRSLLPSRNPVFGSYDIAAKSIPAEVVGGDLFDFLDLGDEILGISIGDASGHGLPAALLVRDVMMGVRMGMGLNLKMLSTLKKLNSVIHRTTYSTRFISLFYCELEKNGNVLYANAGHGPGIIFDEDDVRFLEPTGTIIGPIENIPLERAYAHLPKNATLLLFTDGITERVLPSGESWEMEGLIELVKANLSLPASELVALIFSTAFSYKHESDVFEDDATVVIIKRGDE